MVHKSTERPIKSETIPSSYKQIKKNWRFIETTQSSCFDFASSLLGFRIS
jgi:hypothetical protein